MDLWEPFARKFWQPKTTATSNNCYAGLWRWETGTSDASNAAQNLELLQPYLSQFWFWPANPVANAPCSQREDCLARLSDRQFRFGAGHALSSDANKQTVRSCFSGEASASTSAAATTKKKRVCFIGDSQQENLDLAFVKVVQGLLQEDPNQQPDYTCHRLYHKPITYIHTRAKSEVRKVATAHSCGYNAYIPWQGFETRSSWPPPHGTLSYSLNLDDIDTLQLIEDLDCTDVILNTGHWPLTFRVPWTAPAFGKSASPMSSTT
jgi:hypothetical protein